jgi:trimethylamine--corrinoid protein Co-methyltransferase
VRGEGGTGAVRTNFEVQASVKFSVLSEDQREELHLAAMHCLETTGCRVQEPEALELLRAAGAHEVEPGHVLIPGSLAEQAAASAPAAVTLYTRRGEPTVRLEGNRVYFGTGSDCPYVVDPETGERRRFTRADVGAAMRLCDALGNVDFVMSLGLVSDAPTEVSDRYQFEAMLTNTVKPIVFTAHDRAGMRDIMAMAAATRGGAEALEREPSVCLYAEPSTPLQHTRTAVEKLLEAAEQRLPVVYTPCPMAGGTAPATLAGCLVVAIAENLSGLVIHQLKRAGSPFIFGGVISIMDMRTAILSYGAPEMSLLSAALTDMAHYYRLPMFSTAGCSDAKVLDEQAAIEATTSVLMAALSGANLIHDLGFLEAAICGSLELVALSDEVIGMAKRMLGGIPMSEEELALDVIREVGPGGDFLSHEHTRRHFREHFVPEVIDRRNYEAWTKAGAGRMGERLNARVKKILAEHKPEPVSEEARKEIAGILARAERELVKE